MHRAFLLLLILAGCGRSEGGPPPTRVGPKVPSSEPQPRPYIFQDENRARRLPVDGPIRRGPYVQAVGTTQATICFESVDAVEGKVACDGKTATSAKGTRHEIALEGLKAALGHRRQLQDLS